jgi:DNA (cytosine-5)-methyltransferase 1
MKILKVADLFCGAGGTSTGAIEAIHALGFTPHLTAVNHWDVAIATHSANHPGARHFCASIDDLNPRSLFAEGELDLLWASPECTHHSTARGGRPINDQSRATAHCVTRWAEALRPPVIMVENVPEFETWGPIGSNGRPLQSRKGETFRAWLELLHSLGYSVDYRRLIAANYGDPTTRERLFVQAVRGRRRIVWPSPTHAQPAPDLFAMDGRKPWVSAADIIDWSIPGRSIFTRERPLAPNTMKRIRDGLDEHGGATIIAMEHGGRHLPVSRPLPTITTAKGGAFGVAYILPQQSGGKLRPVSEPVPTISTSGALSLIIEYYGNGKARPVTEPLPTVTTVDRFALIQKQGGDVLFRMLRWPELAAAQGFRADYKFTGTQREITKQIGNAVPRHLSRALCLAVLSQQSDISSQLLGAKVA